MIKLKVKAFINHHQSDWSLFLTNLYLFWLKCFLPRQARLFCRVLPAPMSFDQMKQTYLKYIVLLIIGSSFSFDHGGSKVIM